MKEVQLFTDGSCLGNPGNGGWACILRLQDIDYEKEFSGGFKNTTNNRMEMLAVIEGLQKLSEPCKVQVFSDSQYVCNAIEKKWLYGWMKKNWIKSDKKPVKNKDLWQKMYPLLKEHKVTFNWVRGHAGHAENERCDILAKNAASLKGNPEDVGRALNE